MKDFEAENIKAKAREAAKAALYDAGNELADASKKLVPVDTGNLKSSVYVTQETGETVSLKVGYSAPYAKKQHDDTTLNHTNGQANFLRQPFEEMKDSIIEKVKSRVKEAVL